MKNINWSGAMRSLALVAAAACAVPSAVASDRLDGLFSKIEPSLRDRISAQAKASGQTLEQVEAEQLSVNEIGRVQIQTQQALPVEAYADNRVGGALIVVEPSTLCISHASANTADYGLPAPAALLGQPIGALERFAANFGKVMRKLAARFGRDRAGTA